MYGISPAGVKKVKQKNDGRNWILYPYEPVWNGASWMIPAVETKIKVQQKQGTSSSMRWSHKLMILVATPSASGGDINIKKRTLERDHTRYDVPYQNPMFLPPNPVDLEEESRSEITVVLEHLLLYTKAFIKPNLDDRALTAINHEHYLRIVNANGKNIESRARSEIQLDFYLFDPYLRVFDRFNTKNLKGKFSSRAPFLNFFAGAPCTINSLAQLKRKSFAIDLYFSRF